MFNTLKYTKVLEEVGIPRAQAEPHVQIMTEIIESDLATKNDIKDLRTELKEMKIELKNETTQLEYRLTIKIGTIVTVALAAMATAVKFL